jgi:hypothetical protein
LTVKTFFLSSLRSRQLISNIGIERRVERKREEYLRRACHNMICHSHQARGQVPSFISVPFLTLEPAIESVFHTLRALVVRFCSREILEAKTLFLFGVPPQGGTNNNKKDRGHQ